MRKEETTKMMINPCKRKRQSQEDNQNEIRDKIGNHIPHKHKKGERTRTREREKEMEQSLSKMFAFISKHFAFLSLNGNSFQVLIIYFHLISIKSGESEGENQA